MAKPPPRLFVEEALGEGDRLALSGAHAHYLRGVMRLRPGDPVLLFNGRDGEWRAELLDDGSDLKRRDAFVTVRERTRAQTSGPDLTLLFAPLKKGPTDLVIRMGTELGVARFSPVLTARTQSDRMKTERARTIASEAAEQSERLDVPAIEEPTPLTEVLSNTGLLLFCDEAGADKGGAWGEEALPSVTAALAGRDPAGWSVLIGPEGGFTVEERAAIRSRPGTVTAALGPRILKAETACLAAITLWHAAMGGVR